MVVTQSSVNTNASCHWQVTGNVASICNGNTSDSSYSQCEVSKVREGVVNPAVLCGLQCKVELVSKNTACCVVS